MGQPQQKIADLGNVAAKQEQILQQFGPSSPYMSMQNLYNTYGEVLDLMGYKDTEKYFPTPDPKAVEAWQKQQSENAQKNNPAVAQMEALKEVEQMKAQLKTKTDAAKIEAQKQRDQAGVVVDMQKARMEDDRRRDATAIEAELDEAEMSAKYGATVNRDRMNAEVNRERYANQPGPGEPGQAGQMGAGGAPGPRT